MVKISIFGVLLVLILTSLGFFFSEFWPSVFASFADGKWWASGVLNWLIFGLSVAVFTKLSQWISIFPYRNYTVVTKCSQNDNHTKSYILSHSDARAILSHDFEGWQQLKSIISPTCWITTPYFEDAINAKWLDFNDNDRVIYIYWDKLKESEQFDPSRSNMCQCNKTPEPPTSG